MITYTKYEVALVNHELEGDVEYRGLSTDAKPTDCVNGAAFIEIDTGKVYLFDAAGETWNEI